MKALWIILIVLGCALAIAALVFLLSRKGPDLSSYLPLKEPRIVRLEDERVLEVSFAGPADSVISKAYGVLFKAYYGLKGSPKGPGMKSPKARYDMSSFAGGQAKAGEGELKAQDWTGSVAIPIPAGIAVPAQKPNADGMIAKEGIWEYGEVAEILHLGSYESEPPTIDRLYKFIADRGYKMIGDHEEEYLKGPGMGRIDPKDYWTIIRCRVEKAD